jgi:hypothetical protein
MDPLGTTGGRDAYLEKLAQELEAFLLYLQDDDDALVAFVNNRVGFLNSRKFPKRPKLSDQAKAILIGSDYSVVQEVMQYRKSTAVRWVCVWVI